MMNSFLRRTACVTLLFFVWFMVAPDFVFATGAADDLTKAEELYKEMQYEKAVNTLNSFILANQEKTNMAPKVALAYYMLAKIYFDIDEYDSKVKVNLEKVFQYDENFTYQEHNAKFKQLVEEVKGQEQTAPVKETVKKEAKETTQPRVIERPAPKKKKKKFPAILVIGGLLVVGALVYFLVIKKSQKYDLTVSVGEGANGTPSAGTTSYKKGTVVNYSYSVQSGYTNLQVLVDGNAAAASGSITMNENHSITVTTQQVATLKVNSTPTGAQILISGNDTGYKTNHTFTYTSGGSRTVKLRRVGYIEYTQTVNVALGETKTVSKTLEGGFKNEFRTEEEDSILWKWAPKTNGNWSLISGKYVADADLPAWNYSRYNYKFTSNQYTITVKMKRTKGATTSSNSIILGVNSDPTNIDGYLFNYTSGSWVSVWKYNGSNADTGSGTATAILPWKSTNAINSGNGEYNTLKIVRDGSNYTYYINNTKMTDFSNSAYDPGYIFIGGYAGGRQTKLEFDYAYLEEGKTAGSVPGKYTEGVPSSHSEKFAPTHQK